jgi:uncharacterized protein
MSMPWKNPCALFVIPGLWILLSARASLALDAPANGPSKWPSFQQLLARWQDSSEDQIESAAKEGDAGAMFKMFLVYDERGNRPKAVEWLLKAVQAGEPDAQTELGFEYEHAYSFRGSPSWINMAEAVKWYRRAADQGHAGGQHFLGLCYLHGRGADLDEERGLELIRESADQNRWDSLCELADVYAHGKSEKPKLCWPALNKRWT